MQDSIESFNLKQAFGPKKVNFFLLILNNDSFKLGHKKEMR